MASLAIVGASGGLGEKLIARALERGYRVNALVRDPTRLQRQAELLTVFMLDAGSGAGIEPGLERCQHVICAVGGQVTDCVAHVVRELAKRKKPPQRLVLVSRLGASESRPQSERVSGPIRRRAASLWPSVFRDNTQAEAIVRTSKLPYTIIRPTRLTDAPATGNVVAVTAAEPPPHRVSRTDLAHFIIDSLDKAEWAGREVTVGAPER
jgi:uncharacterized protein YbjT (DUF2867 family)